MSSRGQEGRAYWIVLMVLPLGSGGHVHGWTSSIMLDEVVMEDDDGQI